MDFTPPPRVQELLPRVREFLRQEIYPLERDFLRKPFRELEPVLEQKRQLAKKEGLWAPSLPEEYGGMGLSLTEFAFISEELGTTPLGHYALNCQAPDIGNMELLLQHGSPEQKERFLRPLVRGEIRSCFSMTEPDCPGSNPVWLETTARREGNSYVINGRKWFTSSADGAAFAVVMALTNPEAESPHERASLILVPTDAPGFRLVRNIPVMGHVGERWASHAEVVYENCCVPVENRIGPEGAGFRLAQERLGPGRIHHCMRWLGICRRAFELMCSYAAKRELAPGKPLGTRQIIQQWIAQSRAEIHGARLMVLHAAWRIEQEGAYAAREEISLIKFTVANVLQRVLDRAIQVHGGLGVTDETPLAFWYRMERAARIYDGPDEVHQTVVARRILKEYGLPLG